MASACFSRCEQARFCAVAQAAKAACDFGKSQIDVAFDVLGKQGARPHFADDPLDLGPQVAGIGLATSLATIAEGLAGIAGSDEMNAAAPWPAVEALEIVPYRSAIHGLVFHPRHESGRSMGFPLDETDSSIAGLSDGDAELKPAIASAQGDAAQVAGR